MKLGQPVPFSVFMTAMEVVLVPSFCVTICTILSFAKNLSLGSQKWLSERDLQRQKASSLRSARRATKSPDSFLLSRDLALVQLLS